MTCTFFTTSDSDEEEEEKYSSFVDIEEFEDDEEEPRGFEGTKKGSELNSSSPDSVGPVPWDPSESFFAYL